MSVSRGVPLWRGPIVDGVTYSLLSRFLVDRERFRVLVVEGLQPRPVFDPATTFGSFWHTCEEAHASGVRDWAYNLCNHVQLVCRHHPTAQDHIDHWFLVCKTLFPLYVEHWGKHPDTLSRTPVLEEQVFSMPYHLPSGTIVRLRGKFDSVDSVGAGPQKHLMLQENKTKGRLDQGMITRQLNFDLQTMLYVVALGIYQNDHTDLAHSPSDKIVPHWRIGGVRYNVVKRPGIRRKKPTKSNPRGESREDFALRLASEVKKDPGSYFARWDVAVSPDDLATFRKKFLDPLLIHLCQWWEWVSSAEGVRDPFSPAGKGIHWLHPFGVYNILNEGGCTDLDNYLFTGSKAGLTRAASLFGELEGPPDA
jgi:hypothetical protein